MKVIIPVAGIGTRLKPHTLMKPKVLLNVGGKPMIHFIIEQLIQNKIGDSIILITGYMGDKIKNYLDSTFDFKFDYVEQKDPKGLGHAIHCAKESFDGNENEEALIILGDTLFDVDLKELVNQKHSAIGVKEVDDPRRFGVVEKDSKGMITRFVEKPESPDVSTSNEAIVGLYYLKNSKKLFDALDYVMTNDIKVKGEFQLTDALERMIAMKEPMITFPVEGWLDCGKPETLLETNRYLLNKAMKESASGVNENAKLIRSEIIQPVFIGENAVIENSVIGPYATINENCRISNCIISNSIIDNNCNIENNILIDSIIGESSILKNEPVKVNIGEKNLE
jgi:glucose-1-phosphate thymidylyltransferase